MLNTFGVAALSAVEMDYLPAVASAGFSFAHWPASPADGDLPTRWLQAGEALQRFWLTATQFGLSLQPTFATLAFTWSGESGTTFTAEARQQQSAMVLAREFRRTFHASPDAAVFLGRIGEARPRLAALPLRSAAARSTPGNRAGKSFRCRATVNGCVYRN